MRNGKPFAMFFNASPRKGWNTAKMLEAASEGAREAGAEAETVNLYDISFPGCKSCFACKLKNARTNGVYALRDGLGPVLERARQADVLVLGSPIYFSYPTGVYRAFFERLAFPVYSYHYEDGKPLVCRDKVIETANIFTMNCPKEMMEKIGYPPILEENTNVLKTVFGASETLYAFNTYQFADYSRYDMTLFTEEGKRTYRDAHFAEDLASARALGRRLVEKASGRK
ncbi:MAG: flavodoxin family protein [Kiritimatiellae bacterium]|nr:flavodoxin family protein [Kiritimatiellia bacterium]